MSETTDAVPAKKKSNEECPNGDYKKGPMEATLDSNVMKTGIFAGLLSSSCCLLQLALNALSWFNVIHVGCAGFNKVLTPEIRIYLRALTFGWLGLCWHKSTTAKKRGRALRATIITLVLMFLPEMLQAWQFSHPIIKRTLLFGGGDQIEDTWKMREFVVPFMSCEGCESAVKNILEGSPAVEVAEVHYKEGRAKIWGNNVLTDEFDVAAMKKKLEWEGYGLDEDLNAPTGF